MGEGKRRVEQERKERDWGRRTTKEET